MYLNKFSFFLILIGIQLGFSQTIILKDAKTKELIVSATAYNKTKTKSNISNFEGVLDISNFTSNERIYFSHINYENTSYLKHKLPAVLYLYLHLDELSQVILSISKSKEKKNRVAEKIEIITQKQIQQLAPQTAADLLLAIPGLRVQKSQLGGGSPVIRGFEANRVLLVVDNVRMNNAIYRSGHLQNAITINPYSLARVEVIFGPSSVMYGSDALGGVVHFYTKTPTINSEKKFIGNTNTRFSSANNELTQSFGVEFSAKKWASYTAFTTSNFGDLRMGRNRKHGYENWGLVPYYSNNNSEVFNDVPVKNNNPNLQKNTGYSQIDVLQKLNFQLSEKNNLILNFQLSESSNINRFDQLTQLNDGVLKFAEWYYGPQKRLFASAQYQLKANKKWVKEGTITAAYQKIQESRIRRRYGSLQRSYQTEDVNVFSVNADFKVPLAKNRDLTYGVELTHNQVSSKAHQETLRTVMNTIIGTEHNEIIQTRYPDGGSNYTTTAGYINYRQDINQKMTLNTGARYTHTGLQAKFINNRYSQLIESNLKTANSSVTANLGLIYRIDELIQLNTVFSSGFRAPNIDDIGKVREKNGLLTVPNTQLKPEYAYNGEIGITKFIKNKKNQITINGFYTFLKNHIVRDAIALPNNDFNIYDNIIFHQTITNVNGGNAYVLGGTFDFSANIFNSFYIQGNATYTLGERENGTPLASISPFFTSIGLQYRKGKVVAEINHLYTAKKNAENYSPNGADNLEQSPLIDPNTAINGDEYYAGTPSWNVLNTSLQYQYSKIITVQVGVSNVFDIHYKEFASGISAPGRNFRTSLIVDF